MSLNKVAAQAAQEYAGLSGNKEAALDPATISVFVQLVLNLIEQLKACKQPQQKALRTVKNPSLFHRIVLRSTVRNELGVQDFKSDGDSVIKALLSTGNKVTEEDFNALYKELE